MLPYSGRLAKIKLTTLGERRLRGDLIETLKIVNGLVEYGNGMFRLSRSNKNIIRKAINSNNNYDSYVSKLRSYFLPERVRNYWNNLPDHVKFSVDVPSFKSNLESFIEECLHSCENKYLEVSNLILEKIEGSNSSFKGSICGTLLS